MNQYFLFSFLFIGLLSCGETDSSLDLEVVENKDENGNLIEKFSRRKDTFAKQGLYQAFSKDGKIIEEAYYENDSLNGERKLYYESGKIEIIQPYVMDKFEGEYKEFYENEQLKFEGKYADNAMVGIWKKYYDTGSLMEEVYFENSSENGPFKEYYQNGNLKTEGEYLNASENGLLKKYDENGDLIARMQCLKGICQTIWTKDDGEIEFDEAAFKEKVARMKALEEATENL